MILVVGRFRYRSTDLCCPVSPKNSDKWALVGKWPVALLGMERCYGVSRILRLGKVYGELDLQKILVLIV
ncbi:hypothetical protein D3C78_1965230 [compost metagenome]